MRITSTVTSPMTGTKVKPVVISSIVAPEPGSGMLVAMVENAEGQPVQNMPVQAIGPESKTKATNDAGCAVFGAIDGRAPTRSRSTQTGWVDPEGEQEVIKTATVAAGTLTTVDFVYDLAATLTVNVQSVYGAPAAAQTDNSYGVIAAHTGILTGSRLFPAAATLASDPHAQRALPVRGRLHDLQRSLHRPGPDDLPGGLLRRLHGGGRRSSTRARWRRSRSSSRR